MTTPERDSFAKGLVQGIVNVFGGGLPIVDEQLQRAARESRDPAPGQGSSTDTIEVAPPAPDALRITYAPHPDGDPDAGEVVWTWVPYAENDGRGKDRPVLVIARQDADRVYAVKLTSRSHDGEHDFLFLGPGEWDSAGRPSWADVDQVYSVHADGMRREASELDPARFAIVAAALRDRFGWDIGG
jgi:mRNA-degrading endonuclease toxin of MazEF toxin-antitoxin module